MNNERIKNLIENMLLFFNLDQLIADEFILKFIT